MKATSDISGFGIKNYNNNLEKVISCLRAWFSETVKLRNLNSSNKIYVDFIYFNTYIFQNKMVKYLPKHNSTDPERFAKKEIEEMTNPEYIKEIKIWLSQR